MSQTFTKKILTGSTSGMGIKIVASGTPGTAVHNAVSGSAAFDEVWLWAYNADTVSRTLTIEFGDATVPDHIIVVPLPAQNGLVLVVPGLLLQGSTHVTAFASAANVVTVSGFVNAIA